MTETGVSGENVHYLLLFEIKDASAHNSHLRINSRTCRAPRQFNVSFEEFPLWILFFCNLTNIDIKTVVLDQIKHTLFESLKEECA